MQNMENNSNNIFLSWSGKLSNVIAYSFSKYLPLIVQNSKVFFSPDGKYA